MTNYLITFKNTHDAMKADREMKKEELKYAVMPTPTLITKSCGLSIKINEQEFVKVEQKFKTGEWSYNKLFTIEGREFKEVQESE